MADDGDGNAIRDESLNAALSLLPWRVMGGLKQRKHSTLGPAHFFFHFSSVFLFQSLPGTDPGGDASPHRPPQKLLNRCHDIKVIMKMLLNRCHLLMG